MNLKMWNVILFSGIAVGLIGCFLPWGKLGYVGPVRVGTTWLFPGFLIVVSLILAAVFQLFFLVSGKSYLILVVLLTGLVGFFISIMWIGNPVANEPWGYRSFYTVLYGAYTSLVGIVDVIISAAGFLYLKVIREKQGLPNNKSSF